jgi:hypothetical protein
MNELDPEISAATPRTWARGRWRVRTRRLCEGERPTCPDCTDCSLNAPFLADQWIPED